MKGKTVKLSRYTTHLIPLALLLVMFSIEAVAIEAGSIVGKVYCDQNKDGICDCEEDGLKNIHIQIFTERCGGTALQTVSTNEKGRFSFESFDPGTYYISVDLDYVCGGRVPTTAHCQKVQLTAGETVELPAFGYSEFGQ